MNKEFIDYLKEQVSIVEVVSSRVRLSRVGSMWKAVCPFHKEKTGSFHVDDKKGRYHCFGCGASGDVIEFVKEFDKVSFVEAVEIIANKYGIPIPKKERESREDPLGYLYEIMEFMKNYFVESLATEEGAVARDYLKIRKIEEGQVVRFQVGVAPDNTELYKRLKKEGYSDEDLVRTGVFLKSSYDDKLINRYKGRLMFPIINAHNKCVGFGGRILDKSDKAKYINSPETELFKKSQQLYGYNLAKKSKSRQIIISEGYLDVISLHQAGFDGAIAPLGTAISPTQIKMCWKICNEPIIALDGDSAGIKASYRWIDRILVDLEPGKSFKFATLPQGADPDMLVYNNQISDLREVFENAISLSQWLWDGSFSLYPSETPEQKAEIIEIIKKKIETIQNSSIKRFYFQDIKNRSKSLYRTKKTVKKKESLKSASTAKEKIEKILVVSLINHPYIIDRVIEDFVKLEFENVEMRILKEKILKIYTDFSMRDTQKFLETMLQLQNVVGRDFKDVRIHAGFVDKTVEDDVVMNEWQSLLRKYQSIPLLNKDLEDASSNFSFSEESWLRLKALKNEALGRKIK